MFFVVEILFLFLFASNPSDDALRAFNSYIKKVEEAVSSEHPQLGSNIGQNCEMAAGLLEALIRQKEQGLERYSEESPPSSVGIATPPPPSNLRATPSNISNPSSDDGHSNKAEIPAVSKQQQGTAVKINNPKYDLAYFFEKDKMTRDMKHLGQNVVDYLGRIGCSQEIFSNLFKKVSGLIVEGSIFLPACEDAGCQDQSLYWILLMRSHLSSMQHGMLGQIPFAVQNYLCATYLLSRYGQIERGQDSVFCVNVPQRVGRYTQETFQAMSADLSKEICTLLQEPKSFFDFFTNLKRLVSLHTKSMVYPLESLMKLELKDPRTRKERRVPAFGHEVSIQNLFTAMEREKISGCVVAAYIKINPQTEEGTSDFIRGNAEYRKYFHKGVQEGLSLCFHVNWIGVSPSEMANEAEFFSDFERFKNKLLEWSAYSDQVIHLERTNDMNEFAVGKPEKKRLFQMLSERSSGPKFGGTHVFPIDSSKLEEHVLFLERNCAIDYFSIPSIRV